MNIAKLHAEGRKFRTTRDKRAVRILCTDKRGQESVVFMEDWDNQEFIETCSNTGDGLIEPVPVEREGWVVLGGNGTVQPVIYTDQSAAWEVACGKHVARITWQDL